MNNSILFNIAGLAIQNNLSYANSQMSCTLERMSSGLKVNHAKDNAADYTISRKMNVQLSGLDVAMNNLSHGNNLLNIADDVLENMVGQISKIRDLCLKAKTSTTSEEELQVMQEEINRLCYELERQRQTTEYNGAKVFETKELKDLVVEKPYEKRVAYLESTGTQYIDTGYVPNSDTEIVANVAFLEKTSALSQMGCISYANGEYSKWHFGTYGSRLTSYRGITSSNGDVKNTYDSEFHEYYLSDTQAGLDDSYKYINTTQNSNVSFTLFARNGYVTNNGTPSIGYHTKSRLQDFKIYENGALVHSYIPVVDYDGKAALYDEITKEMLYNQGGGEFAIGEEVEDKKETYEALVDKEPTILQIGSNAGVDNTVSVSLGFEFGNMDFDISNAMKANFGIKRADELIDALNKKRSNVGSAMNRIDSISQLQNNNKINLSNTKSSLVDADIAQEASNHARNQILQQISTSLFTQANSMNGSLAQRLLMGI